MGTTRGANKSFPRFFKGSWEGTGHLGRQGALPAVYPYLQAIWFQGKKQLKRKDNASQGSPLRHRILLRCQTELLPVHSPLLRKSCLVSHPPLTYMLKFSGFADLTSCLLESSSVESFRNLFTVNKTCGIHGTQTVCWGWNQAPFNTHVSGSKHTDTQQHSSTQGAGIDQYRHWSRHAFRDIPKAQYTFKSLLVHGILQFTMLITLRCALHRCSSRDIRRWKLWANIMYSIQGNETQIYKAQRTLGSRDRMIKFRLPCFPWVSTRGHWCNLHPRPETHINLFTMIQLGACEWSFRRFTYGNLVTTSPSSKW